MNPETLITNAKINDLRGLIRLEKECFAQDAWPLPDLLAVLVWPGIVRLKAALDGQMVGFVAGDAKPAEGVGWITTIGVLAAYRRRGIATALLTECERQMRMPRVRLSVRRDNPAAIAMYAGLGYVKIDVWPGYYSGGEDALVLERKITPFLKSA